MTSWRRGMAGDPSVERGDAAPGRSCRSRASRRVGAAGRSSARSARRHSRLCAVADGSLDGFAVVAGSRLSPWDYLGGLHLLQAAGGEIVELDGRELVVADRTGRRLLAAGTVSLRDELGAFVGSLRPHPRRRVLDRGA